MRRTPVIVVALVFGTLMTLASPAMASPKSGCPVGTGWEQASVHEIAETIFDGLVDDPGVDLEFFRDNVIAPFDRNGDQQLCLKTMWGDALNPNSNWYGISQFLVRDNSSNATKTST